MSRKSSVSSKASENSPPLTSEIPPVTENEGTTKVVPLPCEEKTPPPYEEPSTEAKGIQP